MNQICKHEVDEEVESSDEYVFFNPGFITSPATCELPSMEEYAGIYNFQMEISPSGSEIKRQAWQYSPILKKAFIIEGRSLPLQFRVSPNNALPGLYVRAVAVYCDPDSATEPVLRCPNHKQSLEDPINKGYKHLDHVVSCQSNFAVYEVDHNSRRHSVCVRLLGPQPGAEWETLMFALMCRSSCSNGINRRPIAIVFTLEMQYQVLGRRVLPVRICASPFRDRNLEESKFIKSETGDIVPSMPSNAPKELGPLDHLYYIPVVHYDDYITLIRYAVQKVKAEYPPGELQNSEINRYNDILLSVDGM